MTDSAEPKTNRGRKTKFNRAVAERILSIIRAGGYIETAAAYAGLHRDTLNKWLIKGRAENCEDRAVGEIVADYEEALAKSELLLLQKVQAAAQETWQPAAWILERRFPDRWGRKRLEVSGPDGSPVPISGSVQFYLPDNGRGDGKIEQATTEEKE